MWGVVKFVDSNDYCVVKSDQVGKGHFTKNKTVDIIYSGTVIFTNPSKAACEKECNKILQSINSLSKCHSSGSNISRVESADSTPIISLKTHDSADIAHLSSQMDKLLASFSSVSRQIFSRLEDLETRQLEIEHVIKCHAKVGEELRGSVSALKSSTTEIPRVPPAEETHPALSYPYRVSKEQADEIQLKSASATSFARIVERKLFKNDEDKDENLENPAAQDKVRWLRDLVKFRYPSRNGVSDETTWNACRKGINDYHRKQRKRLAAIFPEHERLFHPHPESTNTASSSIQETSDFLFLGSPKH